MKKYIPKIDLEKEVAEIISFLKMTFRKQKFSKAVIGISGGIDSTLSLYLLRKALKPENILVVYLPYFEYARSNIQHVFNILNIPSMNQYFISIQKLVDEFEKLLKIDRQQKATSLIRLGNIMARVRMTILFDLAKRHNALVCGTENKSERLLGYFTRFGDAASDIEPISHLYKTQIFELAKCLKVPKKIIGAKPTAGLWTGQTDEGQFGFTYQEADQVLYLHFEKEKPLDQIEKLGYSNVQKIIRFAQRNSFKSKTPYHIK